MKLIIYTTQTANTTPNRNWDYLATVEDREEESLCNAYGRSPEDAIRELLTQIVDFGVKI